MNSISAVNPTLSKRCATPAFGNGETKPTQPKKQSSADKFIQKIENLTPAQSALGSAVLWFGMGFGIDRLLGMAFKSLKSSMKTSLIVNTVFGAVMGAMTYYNEKNK